MTGRAIRAIEWARDNPGKVTALVVLVVVALVVALVALRTDLLPDRTAVVVGALALAGVSVYAGARQVERVQALLGASKADAGTLSPGFVRLDGTAEPASPAGTVTSAHRDGEYLAYAYERKEEQRRRRDWHEERERKGPYKEETVTVDSETEVAPFRVDDGTGSVLVDADRVELEIAWDEEPFLGGEGEYWAAIGPGDDVTVFGRAMPAEERRVAQGGDEDLVLSRTAEDPFLLVTDRSSLRLVAGGVGRILAAVLLAAVAVVVAALVALGMLPIDLLPFGI